MKLVVDGISFAFGATNVVDGVSLRVVPRSLVGIVGPNGAGKSTLLRCLHAALKPTRGSVLIDGERVLGLHPKAIARRVAVVPQSSSPGFPFTVAEFVAMGRYPVEGDDDGREGEAASSALERVRAGHLAGRAIGELSGGEFRKVLIAQALAQEARLLLLDEPLQNLDLRHQLEVMELVRALASRDDAAVVAVLHDLTMAARYCDEIVLVDRGRVVSAGAPDSVLTPENLSAVYGVEAVVRRCAATGALEVVALRPTAPVDARADG